MRIMVVEDDQRTVDYVRNGLTEAGHVVDSMADGRDTVSCWRAARRLQPGVATRHSWDYKNPGAAQFMTATARSNVDQGPSGNTLAASLDDYLIEMPHAGNDVEDHWRLGQVRMSRHEFESKCFQGEGSVRDFCAGQYFALEGHPEIDTHPAAERDFVITELHVVADNNLPRDPERHARRVSADAALSALPAPQWNSLASVYFCAQLSKFRISAAKIALTAECAATIARFPVSARTTSNWPNCSFITGPKASPTSTSNPAKIPLPSAKLSFR